MKDDKENENKDNEVDLGNIGEIELPSIDVSQYIGKKSTIELVTTHTGKFGYYVKVQSKIVDTIEGGKEPIKLRASRIFGLQEDADKKIGWGKDTKLGKYLKKMNVKHYKDLVGKEITVQSQTSESGTDFLTFN